MLRNGIKVILTAGLDFLLSRERTIAFFFDGYAAKCSIIIDNELSSVVSWASPHSCFDAKLLVKRSVYGIM